jgi:demethylmenaquinone methyltransferase/2-methoxy-6-polyprenyl-1,4-benzoquinol methylase
MLQLFIIFAPMSKYSHDHIVPYEDSSLGKKQQVSDMFNKIAFRYDFLNRLLSGGTDLYWRKRAIRELVENQPKTVLDVATGTGDMAIIMTKYLPVEQVIGIDISEGMLDLGRKKVAKLKLKEKIALQAGDSEAINFPDASFDGVTVAFGVRNFEHLELGIKEMRRVLKPGGKLVVLEFSKPKQSGFRKLCQFYMGRIAPGLVQFFSKKQAYQYLNKSVQSFPEGDNFLNIMHGAGFTRTYLKPLSLGICTIYCGTRPIS